MPQACPYIKYFSKEESMKKTLLAAGITLFAGLSIVLAGCSSPTDFNYTENIQSIQGPANVKVSAVTGALKLEWDLVTDATGYEIRRKENVAGDRYLPVGLVTAYENVFYDVIGDDNILEDAKIYVYQVIAISSAATRAAGGVVQSGVTTTPAFTVPADTFPAKGNADVVKPVTNVQADIAVNGHVTITWESENTGPVTYTFVDYVNGFPQPSIEEKYLKDDVTGEGYYRGAVYAEWPNDYYPASALVELTEKPYTIPTVTLSVSAPSLTVARAGTLGDVNITWSLVNGATGYILQKYEAVGGASFNYGVAVWTSVAAAQTRTSSQVAVVDTVPPGSSAWYRLIIQTAKGTTAPGTWYSGSPVTPVTTAPAHYGWTTAPTQLLVKSDEATINDTSEVAIVFQVATDPGYTYSIYRQAVGETNGTGTDVKGAYAIISAALTNFGPAAGTTAAGGTVEIHYTPELPRQKYNYQLRAYKGGVEAAATITAMSVAAKAPFTTPTVSNTLPAGTFPNETQWFGVTSFAGPAVTQLLSTEAVYIYGRPNPNPSADPTPPQTLPDGDSESIGTVTYYDAAALAALTETGKPATPGYWVKAAAGKYYTGVTAEVK
jgi:hypothetical protein